MNICIYGAASPQIDNKYISKGEELGKIIANRGHKLIYGGGATGMMGAVSRGVSEVGGYVVGIVPQFFTNEEILNEKANEIIRPRTMRERKTMLECMSDGYIVTPGGAGTFDEMYELITLKKLNRMDKPIVIYNINGYYDKMIEAINYSIKEKFIGDDYWKSMPVFDDPIKIMEYIENYNK